jgi:hypothetical protein
MTVVKVEDDASALCPDPHDAACEASGVRDAVDDDRRS